MTRSLVITIPDDLEQALIAQAEQASQSLEEFVLQFLSQNLTLSKSEAIQQPATDPLLQLIGSISVDIPDLAENHDRYIGQSLGRK